MRNESFRSVSARLNAFIDRMDFLLSPSEQMCLRHLKDLWIRHGGRPLYPSIASIAKSTGRSKDTIRRHVHKLRDFGVLTEVQSGGGSRATVYEFSEVRLLELAYKRGGSPLANPSQKTPVIENRSHKKTPRKPLANPSQFASVCTTTGVLSRDESCEGSGSHPNPPAKKAVPKDPAAWASMQVNLLVGRDVE